jgi:hypothetical protein
VSERPQKGQLANRRERGDATPILVWNGLVTRLRWTGAERRKARLASPPTVHSSDDEGHAARAHRPMKGECGKVVIPV